MIEDTLLLFDQPALRRKKVTAGGMVLFREPQLRLGLSGKLARIRDKRKKTVPVHLLCDMLRLPMIANAWRTATPALKRGH